MNYLLPFVASVCLVGLKSWQQQNVTYEKIWWIPPTSYCLAGFEIYLWSRASTATIPFWFAVGTGAWVGSLAAVLVHKRLRR